MLIVEADSAEAVKEVVEGDLYWTQGVWNKEAAVILPCGRRIV